MASLGAHENDKAHEVFLDLDRDEFSSLSQSMHGGSIDGGDDGAQGVVIILASEFLRLLANATSSSERATYNCDDHELLETSRSMFGLISQENHARCEKG